MIELPGHMGPLLLPPTQSTESTMGKKPRKLEEQEKFP